MGCVCTREQRQGVCVCVYIHYTIPAKAPTTTGAILPAAVNTEKNPCAVPIKQATGKRCKSQDREELCSAFLKHFLS